MGFVKKTWGIRMGIADGIDFFLVLFLHFLTYSWENVICWTYFTRRNLKPDFRISMWNINLVKLVIYFGTYLVISLSVINCYLFFSLFRSSTASSSYASMSPCQKNKVRVYVPYSTLIALTNEIRETPVGEFLYLFIIITILTAAIR